MSDKPFLTGRLEFLEELGPHAPDKQKYDPIDRYRDFRAVFVNGGATPEQGLRVLWQLIEESRLFLTPIVPGDTNLTFTRIGKQEFGRWLISVVYTEPKTSELNPTQTINEEPN